MRSVWVLTNKIRNDTNKNIETNPISALAMENNQNFHKHF